MNIVLAWGVASSNLVAALTAQRLDIMDFGVLSEVVDKMSQTDVKVDIILLSDFAARNSEEFRENISELCTLVQHDASYKNVKIKYYCTSKTNLMTLKDITLPATFKVLYKEQDKSVIKKELIDFILGSKYSDLSAMGIITPDEDELTIAELTGAPQEEVVITEVVKDGGAPKQETGFLGKLFGKNKPQEATSIVQLVQGVQTLLPADEQEVEQAPVESASTEIEEESSTETPEEFAEESPEEEPAAPEMVLPEPQIIEHTKEELVLEPEVVPHAETLDDFQLAEEPVTKEEPPVLEEPPVPEPEVVTPVIPVPPKKGVLDRFKDMQASKPRREKPAPVPKPVPAHVQNKPWPTAPPVEVLPEYPPDEETIDLSLDAIRRRVVCFTGDRRAGTTSIVAGVGAVLGDFLDVCILDLSVHGGMNLIFKEYEYAVKEVRNATATALTFPEQIGRGALHVTDKLHVYSSCDKTLFKRAIASVDMQVLLEIVRRLRQMYDVVLIDCDIEMYTRFRDFAYLSDINICVAEANITSAVAPVMLDSGYGLILNQYNENICSVAAFTELLLEAQEGLLDSVIFEFGTVPYDIDFRAVYSRGLQLGNVQSNLVLILSKIVGYLGR